MTTHTIASTLTNPKVVSDIQQVLDTVAQDGDIIVLKGRFAAGPEDALRLDKSVTIRSDLIEQATIAGGKPLQWGVAKNGSSVPIAATIDNITFEAFTLGAIRVLGCKTSNVITNCRFLNYHFGVKKAGILEGAWPIVVQAIGVIQDITGSLSITDCHFGAPAAASVPAGGMNNLLHVNNCALDHLLIARNVIEDVYWMGIAVFGVSGLTEIVDNVITKKSSWTARPGSGTGILFGLRPASYPMDRDGSLRIERNTINIEAPDSYGIVVGLYPETSYLPSPANVPPRSITITDNVVHMNGGAAPGQKHDQAALACLGACSSSNWTNNVVTGLAQHGIRVSQDVVSIAAPSVTAPKKNLFEGNHFAGGPQADPTDGQVKPFEPFTASQAQAFVGPTVEKLEMRFNAFGPVSGSNALEWPPPLVNPCAGVAWLGSGGEIFQNDFSSSDIQGWAPGKSLEAPPEKPDTPFQEGKAPFQKRVGCIYLAETSAGNLVEYRSADFPKGTGPWPERQILDLGKANSIEELVKKAIEPVPL